MSDFWSRRKAAVEAEVAQEQSDLERAENDAREAALAERSDEELLRELDLPDPEHLDSPDQVRQFLTAAVPDRLRRRALRRLWRMNPVLANLDGLVDYGEDYTDAACVVENLQTAYQVGKGMLKSLQSVEPDDAVHEQVAQPETVFDDAELPAATALTDQAHDQPTEAEEVVLHSADETGVQDETIAATPRRMRFSFDGAAR